MQAIATFSGVSGMREGGGILRVTGRPLLTGFLAGLFMLLQLFFHKGNSLTENGNVSPELCYILANKANLFTQGFLSLKRHVPQYESSYKQGDSDA